METSSNLERMRNRDIATARCGIMVLNEILPLVSIMDLQTMVLPI